MTTLQSIKQTISQTQHICLWHFSSLWVLDLRLSSELWSACNEKEAAEISIEVCGAHW